MYVAVKGGEQAIENSQALLAAERRGDPAVPELTLEQIKEQMTLAVDRVMTEGSLYDRDLAALAIKQAQRRSHGGDLPAARLPHDADPLRRERADRYRRHGGAAAYLRRVTRTCPVARCWDRPYDYTHRLLDFALAAEGGRWPSLKPRPPPRSGRRDHPACNRHPQPRRPDRGAKSLSTMWTPRPADLTREPLELPRRARPAPAERWRAATRASCWRWAIRPSAATAATIPSPARSGIGEVAVEFVPEELGFAIEIGEITVTECQMINQFKPARPSEAAAVHPRLRARLRSLRTQDHGHGAGRPRAARSCELDEEIASAPAQDEEFVLYHCDNVEASGFVQHLKLPHYVDFQSELEADPFATCTARRRRSVDPAEAAE